MYFLPKTRIKEEKDKDIVILCVWVLVRLGIMV